MEYFIDYSRPMTADDFRAWRAHLRYDLKKAARALHVGAGDVGALESGTRPVDGIAQDCCRIAELVEHRRAARRKATPVDPNAEPPIDPDGDDPRLLAVECFTEPGIAMTAAEFREWRDHVGYTLHQAARRLRLPVSVLVDYEAGCKPIASWVRNQCRSAEVWEWRKAERRRYQAYWRRRGEPPPEPPPHVPATAEQLQYIYRKMSPEDFRGWLARRGWNNELAALYLGTTAAQVQAFADGEASIDGLTRMCCWSADRPRVPRQKQRKFR